MTFVITALVENALLFRQLASVVEIDLLDTGPLTPFARVAVFSTLALIGAQAAFPIMLLEGNFTPTGFFPGFLATVGPLFLLLGLPIWPLHRRLRAAKQSELASINKQLAACAKANPLQPETLEKIAPLVKEPLINYRLLRGSLTTDKKFVRRTSGHSMYPLLPDSSSALLFRL